MRILFLTDNFPPEVNAPATRTYEHCKEWVNSGVEVTVVTCAPNFPQGKVYDGYGNKLWQEENIDGIRVIRIWTYITANEGFLKRVLDYLSFAFSSFWAGLFLKSDLIVATSPQFFTTWSAYALSLVKRIPWVFEVRDLWPESIKSVGAVKQSRIIEYLEKIEIFLYGKARQIVVVTEAFRDNLITRGIDPKKIEVVTNGANLELFQPFESSARQLGQDGLESKFIIAYIGTHGMAHGLDFIIYSATYLNDPEVHFLFIGDGAEKDRIRSLAKELKLANVTFFPSVPKDEVPKWLAVSDVCLVPLKRSETFKTVIPSKIFEAAAMEKPILLGVEGQAKEIVETYDAGICFEPENKDSFWALLKG